MLSAIKPLVPWQTPSVLAATQLPLKLYCPAAQTTQSFDDGPVHVWQVEEHSVHTPFAEKLPSGQGLPFVADCGSGSHFVLSVGSRVKPLLHVVHCAVESAHSEQPSSHTKLIFISEGISKVDGDSNTLACSRGAEEEARGTLCTSGTVGCSRPTSKARALAVGPTLPINAVAS